MIALLIEKITALVIKDKLGISAILASVRYARIDDAVRFLLRFSSLIPLAKFDLNNAYRIIPVHPNDVLLLGMR